MEAFLKGPHPWILGSATLAAPEVPPSPTVLCVCEAVVDRLPFLGDLLGDFCLVHTYVLTSQESVSLDSVCATPSTLPGSRSTCRLCDHTDSILTVSTGCPAAAPESPGPSLLRGVLSAHTRQSCGHPGAVNTRAAGPGPGKGAQE